MVFLAAVDIFGIAVAQQRCVSDESTVRVAYDAFYRELNEGNPDDRTRYAIHALGSDQHWRSRDREYVHSDAGYYADRSCDAGRCMCKTLGLPKKTHPHRISA